MIHASSAVLNSIDFFDSYSVKAMVDSKGKILQFETRIGTPGSIHTSLQTALASVLQSPGLKRHHKIFAGRVIVLPISFQYNYYRGDDDSRYRPFDLYNLQRISMFTDSPRQANPTLSYRSIFQPCVLFPTYAFAYHLPHYPKMEEVFRKQQDSLLHSKQ